MYVAKLRHMQTQKDILNKKRIVYSLNFYILGNNIMRKSYIEEYKNLYHGTIEEYANIIIDTQSFIPSENGWCGSGVYFYDNRSKAWWSAHRTSAIKNEKGNSSSAACIVIADVKPLSRSSILDLRSNEDLKDFADFVENCLSDFHFCFENKISEDESLRLKRAMLLSFYCLENNIKLIVGYFRQNTPANMDAYKKFVDDWQLAIGIETIYCVKDVEIICNIRRR